MPLIPWLEKHVHGDPNFNNDIRKVGFQGTDAYKSGTALADEGVAGIRKLGDQYASTLAGGGSVLPSSTQSALKRARGLITDTNTRNIMSTAARLRQARVASGGRLSPEAAQEYQTEAETEANRQQNESNVALAGQEAGLELTETNTLRDRLAQARALVLGAGQFRQQIGQAGQLGSLGLRLSRNQAIASTIASFFGTSVGGGGIGGGAGGFTEGGKG